LPSVSIKGFRDAVQVFEVPWKTPAADALSRPAA